MDKKLESLFDDIKEVELFLILDTIRKRTLREPNNRFEEESKIAYDTLKNFGVDEDKRDEWYDKWSTWFKSLTILEMVELIDKIKFRMNYSNLIPQK